MLACATAYKRAYSLLYVGFTKTFFTIYPPFLYLWNTILLHLSPSLVTAWGLLAYSLKWNAANFNLQMRGNEIIVHWKQCESSCAIELTPRVLLLDNCVLSLTVYPIKSYAYHTGLKSYTMITYSYSCKKQKPFVNNLFQLYCIPRYENATDSSAKCIILLWKDSTDDVWHFV